MVVNYSRVLVAVMAAVLFTGVSAQASEMDERIVSSANKSYVFKTYLAEDNIHIKSNDGIVTLTGTVKEESHKSLAQNTIESLPGVTIVNNQLVYDGEQQTEKSDGWLAMKVKTSLLYHRNVSGIKTQVSVVDGVVILNGEAENQAQKDLTTEYARDIADVKDVRNEMTINPASMEPKRTVGEKIDDASITAQVKTTLLYHRSTSGLKTHVETNDGVVTLTGKVRSAAEKDLVGKYADGVNGVTKVINNMIVE